MMEIELSNFTIEYDKEISYIKEIIITLVNNTNEILNFFNLVKLSKKKKVVIFTDRKKYKEHILRYIHEFKEWMCGDTNDGNINILEISEARKAKEHRDMSLKEFIKCILHEFVHSCEQELYPNPKGNNWYWEALATNLSGQQFSDVNLSNCDFEMLQKDFINTKHGYSYSYILGKYMIENYSRDLLLEYISNPDLLKTDAIRVFGLAIEAQSNKNNMI